MNRKRVTSVFLSLVTFHYTLIDFSNARAAIQGTGITYQGQLKDSGRPYSGSADIRAALWDASIGPAELRSTCNRPSGVVVPSPASQCVTTFEAAEIALRDGCAQTTVVTEPCTTAQSYYFDASAGQQMTGKCNAPYKDIQAAHNAAPSGSAFYFKGGTYSPPAPHPHGQTT